MCSVSVIHNQIKDKEAVIRVLCDELDLSEEYVRTRVEKYTSMERVKSNVSKEIGDRIREYDLPGVKVDEDYKRYYPYGDLASQVIGITNIVTQIGLNIYLNIVSYFTGGLYAFLQLLFFEFIIFIIEPIIYIIFTREKKKWMVLLYGIAANVFSFIFGLIFWII